MSPLPSAFATRLRARLAQRSVRRDTRAPPPRPARSRRAVSRNDSATASTVRGDGRRRTRPGAASSRASQRRRIARGTHSPPSRPSRNMPTSTSSSRAAPAPLRTRRTRRRNASVSPASSHNLNHVSTRRAVTRRSCTASGSPARAARTNRESRSACPANAAAARDRMLTPSGRPIATTTPRPARTVRRTGRPRRGSRRGSGSRTRTRGRRAAG